VPHICPPLADVGEQQPIPAASASPVPEPKPHCRAIKTDGHRCRGLALDGLHLCYHHFHHRHPALADKDHISVPLLEDHASIQLVMTQIVHGLFAHTLDPVRARTAIWAAQVAAYTLPRPARLTGNEPLGEPVHRIGFDHDGLISADPDPAPTSNPQKDTCNLQPVTCNLERQPVTSNLGKETCNLQPVTSNLNYLCHVSATADEVWALQDRNDLGVNQPPPEQRYIDPYHPAPPPRPFPGWDAPPRTPPPPPPAHESGLPCDCPECTRYNAIVEEVKRKLQGPRRKSRKSAPSPESEDFNPLCPSGKPDCLGPDSEFCCPKCHRIRKARLAAAPPEEDDEDFATASKHPEPGSEVAEPGSGVIPETQYLQDPTE